MENFQKINIRRNDNIYYRKKRKKNSNLDILRLYRLSVFVVLNVFFFIILKGNKFHYNYHVQRILNLDYSYRHYFQHFLPRDITVTIEIVHAEGPFQFLFQFTARCYAEGA